jgi:tetratricopeptide (TPR) repeat protein
MPTDPNRVRDLLLAALERSPEQRPDFLAEVCGRDADLRAEIDRLLTAHADPDSILEPRSAAPADATGASVGSHPGTSNLPGKLSAAHAIHSDAPQLSQLATMAAGTDSGRSAKESGQPEIEATSARASEAPASHVPKVPSEERIGSVIAGRYTLVRMIGEGGMGSVYLASQTEPVKRQVALKLIKSGMDSRGVLARFDAERQALALMDHPNIARIYDGGLTPTGQPFFVMELVQGLPLTKYCDQHRLSVKARLELFVAVCQAIQHAHQKGIIHRDIKPGNVLVTEVDGRPTPKVIDFGVAKATEMRLTDMSFADFGTIVGTPTYMSPEQADPSSVDIDTRTDVYALGVMMYELLAGSPPIDTRQFQRGATLEILRMVREVEPPRPSTKISSADDLPSIAANRNVAPSNLAGTLQGELDWIVMKALEKDRSRRYETANGFARDVQRYLADELVEARPPSRGYRLQKFLRRNKGRVIAASLVALALIGGMIGTSWGLVEARRQEQIALAEVVEKEKARQGEATQRTVAEENRALAVCKAEEERAAREQSDRNARELEELIKKFFTAVQAIDANDYPRIKPVRAQLLAVATPAMERVAAQLPVTEQSEPVLMALNYQLAKAMQDLGQIEAAERLLDACRKTAEGRVGLMKESDASRNNLVVMLREQAASKLRLRRDLAASLELERRAQSIAMDMLANPKVAPDGRGGFKPFQVKALVAEGHTNLGTLHRRIGDPQATLVEFRAAAELRNELLATFDQDPYIATLSDPERERVRKSLNAMVTRQKLALGAAYQRIGQASEAEPLIRDAMEEADRLFQQDPSSPAVRHDLAGYLYMWGTFLADTGRIDEALEPLTRAVDLAERLLKDDPENALYQRTASVAHAYLGARLLPKRADDAQLAFARSLQLRQEMARRDPKNDKVRNELLGALARAGETAQAEELAATIHQSEFIDNEVRLGIACAYAQCVRAVDAEADRARLGNQAIAMLRSALDNGYRDRVYLEVNPDLDPLRGQEDFRKLLAELEVRK